MSKKGIQGKIKLNSFEDLIGGPEIESAGIQEIALSDLHEFRNHPFKVLDDEKMEETIESIREHGVLMPGIVRKRPEGGYEIISGHRRRYACEQLGLATMPVVIKEYTDDEATIIMVDSNIQREELLPSEKAYAYKMKYEALKHQGKDAGGRTITTMGEEAGESGKTIQRYIWLSRLSNDLIGLVDSRKLAFAVGVDVSFLNNEEQEWVKEFIENGKTISTAQSAQIKDYSKKGELTKAVIELILADDKPKQRKITIKQDKLNEYFDESYDSKQIEETIYQLLDEWKSRR